MAAIDKGSCSDFTTKYVEIGFHPPLYYNMNAISLPPVGLNGGASSIWDFVSGNFSPSPSPVFSSLTSTTVSSSNADLARLFRELDEAKRKIKQWEDAWHQVKQVSYSLPYRN